MTQQHLMASPTTAPAASSPHGAARLADWVSANSRLIAMLVSLAGLLLILITLRPYGVPESALNQARQGDPVNQIGFLMAGGLSVLALATLADRRILWPAIGLTWTLVLGVLAISVMITPAPDQTMRSVLLTLIAMIVAFTTLAVVPDERAFRKVFASACLIVLALAYVSVIAMPTLAVHQPFELESQHAGLWRGHYTHKNLAGPIMSVIALFGVYCWRAGDRAIGAIIAVLGTIFVIQTGSKTTLGFLPVAAAIVMLRPLFGSALLVVATHATVLFAAFMLTIGTVLVPAIESFIQQNTSDPTFTGRTEIWRFAIDWMGAKPWFGQGFANFWLTPTVILQEPNFEENWDIRGVVSGHSNYVDMPLFFGVIGAGIVFWALLVAPMIDYVRATRRASNHGLADFFMTVVIFMSLLSLMETFFFNRTDSFWLLVVIAVFGLRLLSRTRLKGG
jgi:O-antigen ligase